MQVSALYFRLMEDEVEKGQQYEFDRERDREKFKLALLGSGVASFADLFPDVVKQAEQMAVNGDMEMPEAGDMVTYKFADAPELTEDEMAAELAAFMEGIDMQVPGDDLYG